MHRNNHQRVRLRSTMRQQRKKKDEDDSEDSSDDPFSSDDEYHPNIAIPVATHQPSPLLPTSIEYTILKRSSDERGLPFYTLQAGTPSTKIGIDNVKQPLFSDRERSVHSHDLTSSSSSTVASTPAEPTLSTATTHPRFRVPLSKILDFVSPLQLETFEHYICRRPDLDPYLRRLRAREQEEEQEALRLVEQFTRAEEAAKNEIAEQVVAKRGRPPKKLKLSPELANKGEEDERRVEKGKAPATLVTPSAMHVRKTSLTLPIAIASRSESEEKSVGDVQEDIGDEDEPEYEVEDVLEDAVIDGEQMYLVKWAGFGVEDSTWEREADLEGARELLGHYLLKKMKRKMVGSSKR